MTVAGTSLIHKYSADILAIHPTVFVRILSNLYLLHYILCVVCASTYSGAVVLHNQALSSSVYTGLPLLRYVACNGTEPSLADCDYDVLLSGYCNYNFAGVYCQGDIATTYMYITVYISTLKTCIANV